MRRMGKTTQAARHFDNALAIVARMDGEQVLHESEGDKKRAAYPRR